MRWVDGMDDGNSPSWHGNMKNLPTRTLIHTSSIAYIQFTQSQAHEEMETKENRGGSQQRDNVSFLAGSMGTPVKNQQQQSSPHFVPNTTHLIHRRAVASFSRPSVFSSPFLVPGHSKTHGQWFAILGASRGKWERNKPREEPGIALFLSTPSLCCIAIQG